MSREPHPFEGREDRWDRVGEVYEKALAVPTAERAAFLDRACAGEPDVRAEVEGLLGVGDGATARFGRLGDVARSALADLGPGALPAPGSHVGSYRIEGPLGEGGMGTVVRAFDERLERPVALKFLHPGAGARDRERLLREARAVAALDHPHICTVYAVEADAARPFLVLALYEGETLRDRLRRGPLPLADALAVAEQTAGALAAAHAAGVVHRDLKPANVLLVGGGEGGDRAGDVDVRLLDFGIARRDQSARLTQTGASVGTPGYMAPEQVRGETAGPPADLWAVGVVLYEMLVGARPFTAETASAEIYNVLERDPPALGGRADVPPGVDALVAWLLEKAPADRPGSAAEVRQVVRFLATGGEEIRRTRRGRRRWALVAAAAVLVACVSALFATKGSPAPESSAVAVMPFAVRGGPDLAYLGEGLVDLLSTGLDGIGGLRSVDPNAVIGRAGGVAPTLDEAQRLTARFGAGHFVLGRVTDTGVGFRLDASLYRADGSEETRAQVDVPSPDALLPALDALARQIVADRLDDAGRSLSGLAARTTGSSGALRAYLDGERAMRATQFGAARNAFMRAVEADSSFALAWYRLARAAGWVGADSLNHAAAMRAVALADALPDRTREALAGYQAFREGRPEDAERHYRSSLALAPDNAETWQLLGELLFHYNPYRGRPAQEAREALERARSYAPDNRELLPHLIEFAARRGDVAALDSLVALYDADGSAQAGSPYPALRGWVGGGGGPVSGGLPEVDAEVAEHLVLRIAPAVGDLALTRAAATSLVRSSADGPEGAEARATGHLMLALLDVRAGAWDAARRQFGAARDLAPDRELVLRSLAAVRPDAPEAWAVQARRDVAAWTPRPDAAPVAPSGARSYLSGLLDLRLGRPAAALAAADDLDGGSPLERDRARALRAAVALAAGRPDDALDQLRGVGVEVPFTVRRQSPIASGAFERSLRARALRALGRAEAERWAASLYDGDVPWGLVYTSGGRATSR